VNRRNGLSAGVVWRLIIFPALKPSCGIHARSLLQASDNGCPRQNSSSGLPQNTPRDRTAPPLHSAQVAAPFRQPSFVTPQNWMARPKHR
jgi:hypothetical protein